MEKIDELINKLCPNGVKFEELRNKKLFKFYYGKGNKIPEDIGGIYDVYGANGVVSHINEYNCEDVTIIGHIGAVGMVNRCKGKCFVTYNGTIAEVVDKSKINTQYLYYVLTTLNLPSYKKGSQPFLSVSDFEKICIPIPPIEIQNEIVRILDNFTELSVELSAELEARQKQYEYYRDKLLNFEEMSETLDTLHTHGYFNRLEIKCYKLGEIAEFKTGNKPKEILLNGKYEYINAGTTNSGFTNTNNFNGNVVTTPSRGQGGIGYVGYQEEAFWLGPLCYAIWSKDEKLVINKYLYYILDYKKNEILKRKNTGGVPSLNGCDLKTIQLNIPPLKVQEKIVSILDRFEKLCNDISEGLPAEIEARQKQYEYYRDKLLNFKELKVS